jgi:hypothetical protein
MHHARLNCFAARAVNVCARAPQLAAAEPYAANVKTFCSSPQFSRRQCGWADAAEQATTLRDVCPFCGTVWRGEASPPQDMTGHISYYQLAGRGLSAACRGPVNIRAVFKKTGCAQSSPSSDSSAGCGCVKLVAEGGALSRLLGEGAGSSGTITRCRLADANSQPMNCTVCSSCHTDAPCPLEDNVWYSGAAPRAHACMHASSAASLCRSHRLTPAPAPMRAS